MATARHDVVAEEVDKELSANVRDTDGMGREFSGLSAEIRGFLKNIDGSNPKDETCNRMTEMAGFSLGGFGFFKTRLGMGTYNRERKATSLRQFNTDKDALRGGGLRVPIGNRIAHAAAALTWGTLYTDKPDEDTATLDDCIPHTYESYESFTPDGKRLNPAVKLHRQWTCLRGKPISMWNFLPSSSGMRIPMIN